MPPPTILTEVVLTPFTLFYESGALFVGGTLIEAVLLPLEIIDVLLLLLTIEFIGLN
jgi:hypothetical protein